MIVLSGALLSKGGDYQLNEERTFAIDTTPGESRSDQWTPPSPQIILSSELKNGLFEFELDAFPTDLQWVLLKVLTFLQKPLNSRGFPYLKLAILPLLSICPLGL